MHHAPPSRPAQSRGSSRRALVCGFGSIVVLALVLLGASAFGPSATWQLAPVSGRADQGPGPDGSKGDWRAHDAATHAAALCGTWQRSYSRLHASLKAFTSGSDEGRAEGGDEASDGGAGALSDRAKLRYITFGSNPEVSGIADTLIGLVSTFIVALLERRALIITHPCILAAFDPASVDWRPTPGIPLEPSRIVDPADGIIKPWRKKGEPLPARAIIPGGDNSWTWRADPGEVVLVRWLGGYDMKFYQRYASFFGNLSAAGNIIVEWNRGRVVQLLQDPAHPWRTALEGMGLRLPYVFGCILRFLLRPKPQVEALLAPSLHELLRDGGVCIGVHIRVPDGASWDPAGNNKDADVALDVEQGLGGGTNGDEADDLSRDALKKVGSISGVPEKYLGLAKGLLKCVQKVEHFFFPPPVPVRWLVLSSSLNLKRGLRQLFPHKVFTTALQPRHLQFLWANASARDAACRETVAEWLLFAHCHKFVLGSGTGFPKTAAMYSLRPLSVYLDHACHPEHPAEVATLGKEHSGL